MKLKIGDKLFQPAYRSLREYKVFAINITSKSTLYEIECLACDHHGGANCTMYVQCNGDNYEFHSPTNDMCIRYALSHKKSLFYTNSNDAYKKMYKAQIKDIEDAIANLREDIESKQNMLICVKKKYNELEQERQNEDITG
jgi:hypothetical protein